ncbi:hypothetical protein M9H77_36407 [Catharanthus roseus]|uniref:Uncharacterized protein n=1 Tax=Catharanthus roseus TaxID=4058 RepID=A0ACB9ZVZ9_CATRO|nr:hypothetical protein M9H77_36407 [Catharanthus roseus]
MEAIRNLFNMIGWVPLLTINELYYPEMIYEFYANLHKGGIKRVENIPHQWVLSRIGERDIAFDDGLLNTIRETHQDGIRFYTKNKKSFDPNLYSQRRSEEIFNKGEVLKRHNDRNVKKFDAYGRLLNHMISNIIIPNVGHNSSITNMHSFVMLAINEHRRMNFGFVAIEHMLATQSSSTKCYPYSCFLTKTFQHFLLNLVGVGNHIRPRKIYSQHTFKRIDDRDEDDDDDEENEEQEGINVDKEESDTEHNEEEKIKPFQDQGIIKPLKTLKTYVLVRDMLSMEAP